MYVHIHTYHNTFLSLSSQYLFRMQSCHNSHQTVEYLVVMDMSLALLRIVSQRNTPLKYIIHSQGAIQSLENEAAKRPLLFEYRSS